LPALIVDRFTDDSIAQFRASACIRNEDAKILADSGRGAAAIYLWGYVAEMILKAACFTLLGYRKTQPISMHDLRSAHKLATDIHRIQWSGSFHDLSRWAQLLIQHSIKLGRGHPDSDFSKDVIEHSERIYERWREIMRYKKNRAYPAETGAVARSTEWLLTNSLRL